MIRDIIVSGILGTFMALTNAERYSNTINWVAGILFALVVFIMLRLVAYIGGGPIFSS